jgi:hypothetical protein
LANRLRLHIQAHDSAALDLLTELSNALGAAVSGGEVFQRLESSLSAYDFEQARTHLDTLIEWLRQTGKTSSSTD